MTAAELLLVASSLAGWGAFLLSLDRVARPRLLGACGALLVSASLWTVLAACYVVGSA